MARAPSLEMCILAWRASNVSVSMESPSTSPHHPCTRNQTPIETKRDSVFGLKEFSRAVYQQRMHQSIICGAGNGSDLQPAQRPYCSRRTKSLFSNKAFWIMLRLFFLSLLLSPPAPCFYWAGIIHIKLCFPCGRVPKLGSIFAHLSMMKLFIRQCALP